MSNFITAEGQMKGSFWRIWQEGGYVGHEIVEAVDLQGALTLAALYFPDPSFGKVYAVPEPLGWVQGRDFGDESPLTDYEPKPGNVVFLEEAEEPLGSATLREPNRAYTCSCGFFTFEGEPESIEQTWRAAEEEASYILAREAGTPAGDLLQRTADIVNGARNRTHGDKERSFVGIAKAWTRLFGREFKGSDVARAMVALKEQRLRHGEQTAATLREHVEDICGYWAIYYELRAAEMDDDNG